MWYIVLSNTMYKNRTGSGSIMLKAVCLALAFVTGGTFFAAGVMASGGCGMKCCCQIGPSGMHHGTESQMRSLMGCCSRISLNPCGLQSTPRHKFPEMIPASCCGLRHVSIGPALVLSDSYNGIRHAGGYLIFQFADQKFNPPPLYLQYHSYRI